MESSVFETAYRDLVSRFVETDTEHTSRMTHLKNRFSSMKSSLNSEFSDKQRELDTKREDSLQRLRSKKTIYQEKARPLLEEMKNILENTGNALTKERLVDFFVWEKTTETFQAGAKYDLSELLNINESATSVHIDQRDDNAIDSIIDLMQSIVSEGSKEFSLLSDQLDVLNLFRQRLAKKRKTLIISSIFILSFVLIILGYIGAVFYKQYAIKQVYKQVLIALDDQKWHRVNDEVSKLATNKILDPDSLCSGFLVNGTQKEACNKIAMQLLLAQREAFYRQALEEYSEKKWTHTIDLLDNIKSIDALVIRSFSDTIYQSDLLEYQSNRNLKGNFIEFNELLNEALFNAADEALNKNELSNASRLFGRLPEKKMYKVLEIKLEAKQVEAAKKEEARKEEARKNEDRIALAEKTLDKIPSIRAKVESCKFFPLADYNNPITDDNTVKKYYDPKGPTRFPIKTASHIGFRIHLHYYKQQKTSLSFKEKVIDPTGVRIIDQIVNFEGVPEQSTTIPFHMFHAIPKPTAGWRVGTYRLMFFENGQKIIDRSFEIF